MVKKILNKYFNALFQTYSDKVQETNVILIIIICVISALLISSVAAFSFYLWKVSKSKNELKKQIENLQLELEHQKSNQGNDQSYDSLYEDNQHGHHHKNNLTMAGSKVPKQAILLKEEKVKEVALSQRNIGSDDYNSSTFYNYSIAETN